MTKEKENPRPSPQRNLLSLPQSLLPMRQTVQGMEVMATMVGTGMAKVKHGGPVHQTFFAVDASNCATRNGLTLQPSAMLQQFLKPDFLRFLTSISVQHMSS